ncbi:glycogen synthase, partial [Kipferlia bialata]
VERSLAHSCDTFTTVSEVTGKEASILLDRQPEVLTFNGLNLGPSASEAEVQSLHKTNKDVIMRFVRGHFSREEADIDPEKTVLMFSAGRYEFENKGIDLTLHAMARLNHKMKESGTDKTVVMILIAPHAETAGYNSDTLEGLKVPKPLLEASSTLASEIATALAAKVHRGDEIDPSSLVSVEELERLRKIGALSPKRPGLPAVVTHNLPGHADATDPILKTIRELQLFNRPKDRVKIVWHPAFVNKASPVLPIDYPDFVRGCHLGLFPSLYEPWGLTPAECMIVGVPSVTSNLAGFGAFIESHRQQTLAAKGLPSPDARDFKWGQCDDGIYVVDRQFINAHESIERLSDVLLQFTSMGEKERLDLSARTRAASPIVDWSAMYNEYKRAHGQALGPSKTVEPEVVEKPGLVTIDEEPMSSRVQV